MNSRISKSIAVIVAHPDDETLWAGGTILCHPNHNWFIVCLCRASDTERANRFYEALKILKVNGIMGDMDDGPEQKPLVENLVEQQILRLLPTTHFDLIMTHNAKGEYTRHLRHEEINKAVVSLWHKGQIFCKELWAFAYEDGKKAYFPQAEQNANMVELLSEQVWSKKYKIITETYGFSKDSWEAETTPTTEAFWKFNSAYEAQQTSNHLNGDVKISKLSIFKLLSSSK